MYVSRRSNDCRLVASGRACNVREQTAEVSLHTPNNFSLFYSFRIKEIEYSTITVPIKITVYQLNNKNSNNSTRDMKKKLCKRKIN